MSTRTITINLAPSITFPLTVLVALFDNDSVQYGVLLWPDVPSLVTGTATLFGNLLWIVGVLFAIYSTVVVIMVSEASKAQLAEWKIAWQQNNELKRATLSLLGLTASLFLIASGYWFTGTSYLSAVIASAYYRRTVMKSS